MPRESVRPAAPVSGRAAAGRGLSVTSHRSYGRRQLTGAGAVAVALVTSLVGGLMDLSTGGVIGGAFGAGFVGGCLLGAALVRRRDLRVVVVMGPLVCTTTLVAAELVGSAGSLFSMVAQAGSAVIQNFPTMLVGTVVAVATAVLRGRRGRLAAANHAEAPSGGPRGGGRVEGGW